MVNHKPKLGYMALGAGILARSGEHRTSMRKAMGSLMRLLVEDITKYH